MRGVVTLALLFAAGPPALAEAPTPSRSEFQFFLENDMWFGKTDRSYTNGIKLGLGRASPATEQLLRDYLPLLGKGDGNREIGVFLGQTMYTPRDITNPAPQPFDRPWAAFLYAGFVAQQEREDVDGAAQLDTVELDLGVVGPLAQGEWAQTEVHKRCCMERLPKGWRNQLPNEPAGMITLLRKWRSPSGGYVDFIPHAGFTVGSVMTLVRAGGMVRFGFNLSGFGPDTIEPGGILLQGTRERIESAGPKGSQAYLFAGVDQRLVAYNMTLDGTLFHDSPSVTRRPHVYDLTTGGLIRLRGWGVLQGKEIHLSITRVRRSEEFHTARGGGGRQIFGSLNLGVEW